MKTYPIVVPFVALCFSITCTLVAGDEAGLSKSPPPEHRRRLELAFGPDSDEMGRRAVMWFPKFSVVLAMEACEQLKDGRMSYKKLSLAHFRKRDGKDEVDLIVRDVEATGSRLFPDRPPDLRSIEFDCSNGLRVSIPRD